MRFSVGNRCLMDPNLTWDLILYLIALRGTQLDHLECSRIAVGDVAGMTAWVYIVHCELCVAELWCFSCLVLECLHGVSVSGLI